mgnify:CR=1 FL=1
MVFQYGGKIMITSCKKGKKFSKMIDWNKIKIFNLIETVSTIKRKKNERQWKWIPTIPERTGFKINETFANLKMKLNVCTPLSINKTLEKKIQSS